MPAQSLPCRLRLGSTASVLIGCAFEAPVLSIRTPCSIFDRGGLSPSSLSSSELELPSPGEFPVPVRGTPVDVDVFNPEGGIALPPLCSPPIRPLLALSMLMSGSLRLLCNEVRNVYLPRTGSRSTPAPGLCFSVLSLDRNAPDVFACSGLVPACSHTSPVIAAPPSELSGPYRSPRSFRLLQKQLRAVPPLRFEASCQATAPATSCVLYWLGASRSAPSGRSGRSRVFHHHSGCELHIWSPSRMHSGTPCVGAPDAVAHPVCLQPGCGLRFRSWRSGLPGPGHAFRSFSGTLTQPTQLVLGLRLPSQPTTPAYVMSPRVTVSSTRDGWSS
ncbi:hypothetical protein C8R47DRAFT_1231096 [Mycena vitilis]|nr:hypothetical protein C8R47DRAFT_1231096 [Mycena vitilis]